MARRDKKPANPQNKKNAPKKRDRSQVTTTDTRIRANMLAMFLGGATLREIAQATGFHRNTVQKISVKYGWKKKLEEHEARVTKRVMNVAEYEKAKTLGVYRNVEAALVNELMARIRSGGGTGVKDEDRIDVLLRVSREKLKTHGVDVSGKPAPQVVQTGDKTTVNVNNLVLMQETAKSLSTQELAAGIEKMRKLIGAKEIAEAEIVESAQDDDPDVSDESE